MEATPVLLDAPEWAREAPRAGGTGLGARPSDSLSQIEV